MFCALQRGIKAKLNIQFTLAVYYSNFIIQSDEGSS